MDFTIDFYSNQKSWIQFFKDKKDIERNIKFHNSWNNMFNEIFEMNDFINLKKYLKKIVIKNKNIKIYPYPNFLFSAFYLTRFDDIKVVFIGQDPYFNCEFYNNKIIPQAVGLSFSVPKKCKIPSSLLNIYKNLLNYNHLFFKPTNGDLSFWSCQGCLMLNTALTVIDGQKNIHSKLWVNITNKIIKYISDNSKYVIFVLWGNPALKKKSLIDENKHDVIISSHPSGLSAHKSLKQYSSFNNQDHFGIINKLLTKNNKKNIIWQIQ